MDSQTDRMVMALSLASGPVPHIPEGLEIGSVFTMKVGDEDWQFGHLLAADVRMATIEIVDRLPTGKMALSKRIVGWDKLDIRLLEGKGTLDLLGYHLQELRQRDNPNRDNSDRFQPRQIESYIFNEDLILDPRYRDLVDRYLHSVEIDTAFRMFDEVVWYSYRNTSVAEHDKWKYAFGWRERLPQKSVEAFADRMSSFLVGKMGCWKFIAKLIPLVEYHDSPSSYLLVAIAWELLRANPPKTPHTRQHRDLSEALTRAAVSFQSKNPRWSAFCPFLVEIQPLPGTKKLHHDLLRGQLLKEISGVNAHTLDIDHEFNELARRVDSSTLPIWKELGIIEAIAAKRAEADKK